MNPQNSSRPVMDVSAPRPSQQPPAAAPQSDRGEIAVEPAPPSAEPAKPAAPAPADDSQAPAKKQSARAQQPQRQKTGAPVGVITAAVLAMMLLSTAAVIVYVTSQTA